MKKFLMIALLAMAGITAASDSKTDVGTEITLDEARSLLSGGSSAPGSTVIRLSPIDFKDNKQDVASISISIPGLTGLVDFGISFTLLLAMFICYQFIPPIQIFLLPIFIFIAFFCAFGIGLYLTAVNLKYRDFRYIIPFIVQFGLYITPVGFSSLVINKKYSFWFGLNPMVGVIDGFRWCLLGEPFQLISFMQALIITILFLWLGVAYFRKMERTFADNI